MRVRNKSIPYTEMQLRDAIKSSLSWKQVIQYLNPNLDYRGSQSNIKKKAVKFNIDFSHFLGQSWNKGRIFKKKRSIEEYFNGVSISSNSLKKRMVEEGIKKWKCEKCNNSEWLGERIPLELHHIDHNPKNNSLINLKLVCPNCHYKEHNSDKDKEIRKAALKYKNKGLSYKKLPRINTCPSCGKSSVGKYCSYDCSKKSQRRVDRPTKEILETLLMEKSFTEIGKIYGVSDNAIRKWAKQYGTDLSISKFKHKGRVA